MRTRSVLALRLVLIASAAVATSRASVCLAGPTPAAVAPNPTGEQAEFDKARNAYKAKEYEEADSRFFSMLDPKTGILRDPGLIKEARMYWAATLIAEQRESDAEEQFRIILREEPNYEPDPIAFPLSVVNAFIDARAKYHEELDKAKQEEYRRLKENRAKTEAARQREAERIKTLERLSREVEVTEKHSRWIALLPFGIGQFQNGQRKAGWFFLVSESLFAATGIATIPLYVTDLADAHDASSSFSTYDEASAYTDRANAVRYVNLSAYGALAVTAIIGAIQAEVAYVPDLVTTKPRAIPAVVTPPPAAPAPAPISFGASPLPGRDAHGIAGGALSVTVSF